MMSSCNRDLRYDHAFGTRTSAIDVGLHQSWKNSHWRQITSYDKRPTIQPKHRWWFESLSIPLRPSLWCVTLLLNETDYFFFCLFLNNASVRYSSKLSSFSRHPSFCRFPHLVYLDFPSILLQILVNRENGCLVLGANPLIFFKILQKYREIIILDGNWGQREKKTDILYCF